MSRILLFVVLLPVTVVLGVMLAMFVGGALYGLLLAMGESGDVGHLARWRMLDWIASIGGAIWGWMWAWRRWGGILLPLVFAVLFISVLAVLQLGLYGWIYGWEALGAMLENDALEVYMSELRQAMME